MALNEKKTTFFFCLGTESSDSSATAHSRCSCRPGPKRRGVVFNSSQQQRQQRRQQNQGSNNNESRDLRQLKTEVPSTGAQLRRPVSNYWRVDRLQKKKERKKPEIENQIEVKDSRRRFNRDVFHLSRKKKKELTSGTRNLK